MANTEPPADAAYHCTVAPLDAVAEMVTCPVPVLEPGVVAVMLGLPFTYAVISAFSNRHLPLLNRILKRRKGERFIKIINKKGQLI